MKKKNFRLSLVVVSMLLTFTMCFAACTSASEEVKSTLGSTNSAVTAIDRNDDLSSVIDEDALLTETDALQASDKIGLIVEMEGEALIDIYLANPSSYSSFQDFLLSTDGRKAAENLKNKQAALFNKIARSVDVSLKYNYTSVMNGIAIEITYGDRAKIDAIAEKNGVSNTLLSEHYEMPEATVVTNYVNAYDTGIFDSSESLANGYGGQGMVVAVLDTGLDHEHIAFDENYPLFAEDNTLAWDKAKIESLLPYLSANTMESNLNASDLYVNTKVPFGFDYADFDTEVNTHEDNSHGTHVAGIIAGHSDDPKGENGETLYDKYDKEITGITGVAPKAQLAIMKVFSDYESGAESESLLAALEDCVVLGVDVINMSLGAASGFQEESKGKDTIYHVYERVGDVGISLVVAAGNAYSSGFMTHYGLNLISNPDSGVIGSPSSYDPSFTVASIAGVKSKYLAAVDSNNNEYGVAYFQEAAHVNSDSYDFIEDIKNAVKNKNLINEYVTNYAEVGDDMEKWILKIPYVTIPGIGQSAAYAGLDVSNKIVLVSRGTTSFEDKIEIARDQGALACIIFNNVAGIIRMQVGDDVNLPSCSVTMDAAAAFKNEKNAYFLIDESLEAGPFMSEFSSWGPLPNLVLKPEITAHGGEIYSAIPGDETSYARLSGTSMACPNMAGVVALMRQFMSADENATKFGLYGDNGEIDKTALENRIYQVLMSTATIANNEEGNPYSPRKQGSGLADLVRSQSTEQYLTVMEKITDEDGNTTVVESDRTKIELYDDPEKTGVYTLEFYANNVGSKAVTYKPSAIVMTEGISSDGKTVTEKARILTGTTQVLSVNDVSKGTIGSSTTVEVPAKGSVKISIEITLGAADREWLDKFPNGMYVEGFACLDNVDENGIDLNVPYLAFYGDWSDAPIRDYDIYETTDDLYDDSIDDDDKRYSGSRPTAMYGKVIQNNNEYVFGMGQFIFYIPEEYGEGVAAEEDKCALSFNNDDGMCNLYCVGGFLRGAKKMFYTIECVSTGEMLIDGVWHNARKAGGASGLGGAWFDIDISSLKVINNAEYKVTIYPVIDWNADQYTSREQVPEENVWSSTFWVDTDAPFISDTELRIERDRNDNASYYLDLYVTDNHYSMALSFDYYDMKEGEFVSGYSENGLRPISSDRNSTTRVTFNITSLWDQISEGLLYRMGALSEDEIKYSEEDYLNSTKFQTGIYDYAFNKCFYEIDIAELVNLNTALKFGDIGEYTDLMSNDGKTIHLLTKYNDQVTVDANGDKVYYVDANDGTAFSMIVGQKVELMKSVIATPTDAIREDLVFSVSNPEFASIDPETGELYATAEGLVVVTVRSRTNEDVSAKIKINILGQQTVTSLGVNIKNILAKSTPTSLGFVERYQYLNSGERYLVEVELEPWYIDNSVYNIRWEVANTVIATIEPYYDENGNIDPYKQWVVANASYYDDNGEYVSNISGSTTVKATVQEMKPGTEEWQDTFYIATFTAMVYKEFVVEGNKLTEYHGLAGDVVIPDNLSITTTSSNLFYKRDDITSIVFPEGFERVAWASCAYMPNLKKVVLPSTIIAIDGYAFAAWFTTGMDYPVTMLEEVDMSACTNAIYVGRMAFGLQMMLGLDADQSVLAGEYSTIVYNEDFELDITAVRSCDIYAFYGCWFIPALDLSGIRAAEYFAFAQLGYGRYIFSDYEDSVELTFSEKTRVDGQGVFAQVGASEIVIPMQRVDLMMFGGTVSSSGSMSANAAIKKLRFTADDLVIETYGFLGCINLEEIVFEGDVDVISDYAFYYCESLKTLEFKGSCRVIGANAFTNAKITELTLPAGLTDLGHNAFGNCTELETVIINKDCTLQTEEFGGNGANMVGAPFYRCTKLSKYVVEAGHQYLSSSPDGMLMNAEGTRIVSVPAAMNLADYVIPSSVKEIGAYAFTSNTTLNSIDLSNIELINEGAFYNCIALEEVTFGANIEKIPVACFYECSALTTVNLKASTKLTTIGTMAFGYAGITSISLPSSVTTIEAAAFTNSALTSFVLPAKVTRIEDQTFYYCQSLSTIYLNDVVEFVGRYAFTLAPITRIDSKSITYVSDLAFGACYELETVKIPNATYIGKNAFMPATYVSTGAVATKLKTIDISGAKTIGESAFASQLYLTNLNLASATTIGDNAFAGCTGVTSINIEKAETIGEYAFSGIQKTNANDTYIYIPAATKSIASTAFADSPFTKYVVDSRNTAYFADEDGVLYANVLTGYELTACPKNIQISEYSILDGTVRIDRLAFYNVQNIVCVNIASSVNAIGDMAFYYANTKIFNFLGLTAPELEAYYSSLVSPIDSDDVYFWQVYANFYLPFSINLSSNGAFGVFKYNSIRVNYEDDNLIPLTNGTNLQNDSYNGGGFVDISYGLVITRPSNGVGYDSFVFSNYFDTEILTPEVLESATQEIMDIIAALPDSKNITANDKGAVENARNKLDGLASHNQKQFIADAGLIAKLEECEKKLATVTATDNSAVESFVTAMDTLFATKISEVTVNNKGAVQAARTAYDRLTASQQSEVVAYYNSLLAYEDKIATLESGSNTNVPSTTVKEGPSFGLGLAIGLIVAVVACVAVVVFFVLKNKKTA